MNPSFVHQRLSVRDCVPKRMTTIVRVAFCAGWCLAVGVSDAPAQGSLDAVYRLEGGPIIGTIESSTPVTIRVERRGQAEEVSLDKVVRVQLAHEPPELRRARDAALARKWQAAADEVQAAKELDVRLPEAVQADLEFYDALIDAHLALAGQRDVAKARLKMLAFGKAHRTSFHFFEAAQILAELDAALGKSEAAVQMYEQWVVKAPWASYQARALRRQANLYFVAGDYQRAIEKWNRLETVADDLSSADRAKVKSGKAVCEMAQGKQSDGVERIERLLRDADVADEDLMAALYLDLGRALQVAERPFDALLSYLHIDLLYSNQPVPHAEALAKLSRLWAGQDRHDRARDARKRLKEQYGGTSWARTLEQ